MKTIKKLSKQLAWMMLTLMLIQSCVAYGPPIALEEAVKQTQKTKVRYDNDEIHRFLYVEEENGNYYGKEREKGEVIKTKIDVNRIEIVRAYDKSRSTMATVLTPIVIAGVVIGIAAATYSPSFSFGE